MDGQLREIMGAIKLVCANAKGGVGKTTTSSNLAGILANNMGFKVLCIDADSQANLSIALGIDVGKTKNSLMDIFTGNCNARDCVVKAFPNIDIIPATMLLDDVLTAPAVTTKKRPWLIMKSRLEELSKEYDFVFIDTASAITLLTWNSLAFADRVIIPLRPDFLADTGVYKITNVIATAKKEWINRDLDILMIVATHFQKTNDCTRHWDEIRQVYNGKTAQTTIRMNVAISESVRDKKPLSYYRRDCNGYRDYLAVAEELIKRLRGGHNAA